MEATIWSQVEFFIFSLIAGGAAAFIYDLFRISRRMIKTKNAVIFIEDIVFLLIIAVILFVIAYRINNGQIRWYEFFSAVIGFTIYRLIAGGFIVNTGVKVVNFVILILVWILRVIMFPILLIYRLLKRPFGFIMWHVKSGAKKTSVSLKIKRERFLRNMKLSKNLFRKRP